MNTTPTRARYVVLLFVCTLSLITYLDRICIMRAKQDIQADLGFTDIQFGWVFAAFAVGYAVFEVPGGWMGDRWGTRRVLTRIVLCWSVFTALTGLIPAFPDALWLSLALMVGVRFLFGVGEAGAYPNINRVVAEWFPFKDKAFALGAVWMWARIGGAFAPLAIGTLTRNLGWRNAFFVLGVVGIAWAVAFRRWFVDRPDKHPAVNDAELALIRGGRPPEVPDVGHGLPPLRLLLGSLTIWAMCGAAFWVCAGWYFYPTWQPEYLKQVHGFAPTGWVSEVLTGLPFLCGALGSLAGGGISDRLVRATGSKRWGRSLVGVAGFVGAGACVLLTGYATEAWQAVTLLCLAFLINDLAIPVLWAACSDISGRYTGSISGLMNMIGAGGAILTPAVVPYVLAGLADYDPAARWRIVFTGLAGTWFLGAVCYAFIDAGTPLEPGESGQGVNRDGTASVEHVGTPAPVIVTGRDAITG